MLDLILAIVLSYLLGALCPSLWLTKLITGKDLRTLGSGNLGATNAWRNCGWKVGLPVGLVDLGKGFVATFYDSQLIPFDFFPDPLYAKILCGFVAIFGHMFSVFANFKGGKGVLTAVGLLIGLMPQAVGACVLVWIIAVALTRMVSVGSIVGALALPVAVFFLYNNDILQGISIVIAILIVYTHRTNIQRILKGEESKIPIGKKNA
ncbi:MAG: glycerol-3-phosphate 1-O-acyltransferase [Calditrichaeota bacterium]|nr:MAG: glycerol-3-phosphate 1-O-acyltransferase [Calditrichota bacterium]